MPTDLHIVVTLFKVGVKYSFVAVLALGIKAIATAWFVLMRPVDAIRSIPDNFRRVLLCTDIFCPPELVPGYNDCELECDDLKFESLLRMTRGAKTNWRRALFFLVVLPMHMPALAYRWSLKSNALVFAPIVWVAHRATNPEIDYWLAHLTESSVSRIARWVAGVLAALALTMSVTHSAAADLLLQFLDGVFGIKIGPSTLVYLQPHAVGHLFPWWRAGAFAALLLVLTVQLMAEGLRRRREYFPVAAWRYDVLRALVFLRGMAGLFMMACTWQVLRTFASSH